MRLYHFTAERFVAPILRHGITRGFVVLSMDPPRLMPGYRCLTCNPAWEQEWAEGTWRLPYRRNESRLTVDVPADRERHVLKWTSAGPILTPAFRFLSILGDPENWRLFNGDVPPAWIVGVDHNPLLVAAPTPEAPR